MKSRTLALSVAAVALAAVSCSKSPSGVKAPEDLHQIRVRPTVVAETKGEYTLATMESFDLLIDNPRNSRYSYTNTRFTKDESGKWASATPMLWEKPVGEKQAVFLLAISPALPTGGHAINDDHIVEIEIEPVQSADSRASDYLFCNISDTDWGSDSQQRSTRFNSDGELMLMFMHMVSKLRLEVTFGTDLNFDGIMTESPITNLKVGGTKLKGNFKKNTAGVGYITDPVAGSTGETAPFLAEWQPAADKNERSKAVYECMLIPQRFVELELSFEMGGMPYTWKSYRGTPETQLAFEYGKRHTLPISIGKDGVIVGEITTTPWNDGGEEDIETN